MNDRVAGGGAFGLTVFDRQAGPLRGQLREQLVTAAATRDVIAFQLTAQHLFDVGERGAIVDGRLSKMTRAKAGSLPGQWLRAHADSVHG